MYPTFFCCSRAATLCFLRVRVRTRRPHDSECVVANVAEAYLGFQLFSQE